MTLFKIVLMLQLIFIPLVEPAVSRFPTFQEFCRRFNKTCSSSSGSRNLEYRERIYYSNIDLMERHNSDSKFNYTLDINEWADLTWDEFKQERLRTLANLPPSRYVPLSRNVREVLDWRTLGKVSPIKNQGPCGSCWAFSAVSALESVVAIKSNRLYDFSEQHLVDCDTSNLGCNGGLMSRTYNYMKRNGITLESQYPYVATKGVCQRNNTVFKGVKGFQTVLARESSLFTAVKSRPVSVGIEVDSLFRFYKSGVYNRGTCTNRLNHAVNIVGFGTENNLDFWIVRNSWGGEWGDRGYIKMIRNRNICGINNLVSYPVV